MPIHRGGVGDRKEQQHPHNEATLISHGVVDKLCILKPNTQENEQFLSSFLINPIHKCSFTLG